MSLWQIAKSLVFSTLGWTSHPSEDDDLEARYVHEEAEAGTTQVQYDGGTLDSEDCSSSVKSVQRASANNDVGETLLLGLEEDNNCIETQSADDNISNRCDNSDDYVNNSVEFDGEEDDDVPVGAPQDSLTASARQWETNQRDPQQRHLPICVYMATDKRSDVPKTAGDSMAPQSSPDAPGPVTQQAVQQFFNNHENNETNLMNTYQETAPMASSNGPMSLAAPCKSKPTFNTTVNERNGVADEHSTLQVNLSGSGDAQLEHEAMSQHDGSDCVSEANGSNVSRATTTTPEEPDDGSIHCLENCLYYTIQCCDCTIL